jgi:hypothetical protein
VWVAERDAKHLNPDHGIDQLEIIDACLDAIEASKLFILVDTGEYGSHLHVRGAPSESSFLELELFQAVLLSKPIHYVKVTKSSTPSPLLQLLSSLKSDVELIETSSLATAETEILRRLDLDWSDRDKRTSLRSTAALTDALVEARHNDWSNRALFVEPQFLRDTVCGTTKAHPELDVAEHYLILADQQSQTNRVLSRTWIAMRALMINHFSETTDPKTVALWDRAFKTWSRAAAWRGLHAHLWLGNVAALGSLAGMRLRTGAALFDPSLPDIGDLFDNLASVYYSISKRVSTRHRSAMLSRSSAYVEAGLADRDSKYRGSLLPIRGSINHRNHKFRASVRDFTEALNLAIRHDAGPGQIGFLLTELGFAELFLFKFGPARRRIEEGLSLMTENTSSPGFRVRALRKHVRASLACFDIGGAKVSARLALQIAEKHRLYDQIDPLLRRMAK